MSAVALPAVDAGVDSFAHRETAACLGPGQVFFTRMTATITTMLGSSVAVTLWDPETCAGGMTHYVLPRWTTGRKSTTYGDVAIDLLLANFERAGIPASRLEARAFGTGAAIVSSARALLAACGVPDVEENVEEAYAMRLCFRTEDGSATIELAGDIQ